MSSDHFTFSSTGSPDSPMILTWRGRVRPHLSSLRFPHLSSRRFRQSCRVLTFGGAEEGCEMSDAIVVGTDGSDTAKQAVSEAVRMAKALSATVHVVSAFSPVHAKVHGAPEGAAQVWQPLPHDEVEGILSQAVAG